MTDVKQPTLDEGTAENLWNLWTGINKYVSELKSIPGSKKLTLGQSPALAKRLERKAELVNPYLMTGFNRIRVPPGATLELIEFYDKADDLVYKMDMYMNISTGLVDNGPFRERVHIMRGVELIDKEYLDKLRDEIDKGLKELTGVNPEPTPEAPPAPSPLLNITAGTVILSIPPLQ